MMPTNKELIEKLKIHLLGAAGRVNQYAAECDHLRNYTNYGYASCCANILRTLEQDILMPFYEDGEGLFRIENVVINNKKTCF